MKRINVFIISLLFLGCSPRKAKVEANTDAVMLKAMTYNLRLDIASDGENTWAKRKDVLSSQILFLGPDVFGVQEARPNQIQDLNTTLTDYKFVGEGRDGNGEGEHSAIYYNTKNLQLETAQTFWLSLTPEVVSKGWDGAYPRICTYALFSFKKSGKKFWLFNTHLDHVGQEAQKEGVKLILKRMTAENTENYPVLLMGDFNVEPNSEVIATIVPTMSDSKHIALLKFGPDGTFNGFNYNTPVTRRIDYVFVSKSSDVLVKKYAVLSSAIDLKFPSDHFPVFTEIELK